MKLIAYFKNFLETTVNLNDSRIATLNQRVDAITSFLRNDDTFSEYFLDVIPQGSYALRTIIKPVGTKEYDADVLLSLKEHPDWSPKEYTGQLKRSFEASSTYQGMSHKRTRCVYVDYADDFHVDVVPYVESTGNITNNKTDDWEYTDPQAFTAWFTGKGRIVGGGRLQAVVRLLKYLRDSKTTFSIKSVLLVILVGERIDSSRTDQDDKYYADLPTALVNIIEDLDDHLQAHPYLPSIMDPAGTGQDFSQRWDQDGYANFRTQIHTYATKIRQAYDSTSRADSLAAWQDVFGSSFQAPPSDAAARSAANADPGEEYIDRTRSIPVKISQEVRLTGRVRRAGVQRPYDLPKRGDRVEKGRTIDFSVTGSAVFGAFEVYWKVKNTGREAVVAGQLRGDVVRGDQTRSESTAYVGSHYVEVYIVKGGVCVARDRQPVVIQPRTSV